MALPVSSLFLSASLLSLCLISSLHKGSASDTTSSPQTHHTLQVTSLLPSSVCNHHKGPHRKSTLKVVHKHGPCSHLHQGEQDLPSHADILLQDEARVNSIHSRIAKNSGSISGDVKQTDAANLPAKDGNSIGSANYFVTVGLGSPKKDLSLIFDTGSDLTWTQCEPCIKSCYDQKDPKFNPSESRTYTNVSCSSSVCSSLSSATGNSGSCASSTCVYGIQYGDSSFSVGFFARERLTLTSTEVFDNFLFGCGQNNQGLFGGTAGLLGLGRDQISLPSQTANKYDKFFSYCLPASSSSTGYLTFGRTRGLSRSVKYTPLTTISQGGSFYGISITAISVGGQKLSISPSLFSTSGAIIDSGTVITRLPPAAYSELRSAFRQRMSQYPMAGALSILDTCYDFSKYTSVAIPKISMFLSGGVEVPIDARGILYVSKISQVCLAFAANSDDTDVTIFGNVQQKTLQVVYDGAGGKVGFATGGCS